jgi:hypothetical protein
MLGQTRAPTPSVTPGQILTEIDQSSKIGPREEVICETNIRCDPSIFTVLERSLQGRFNSCRVAIGT